MFLEIEQSLYAQYPRLFRHRESKGSPMCFGCECGEGWLEIIKAVCRLIDGRDSDPAFTQIKEKWGTLRIYHDSADDPFVDGVIRMAEEMSSHTCERCGHPGRGRGGGWLVTLCDSCDAKR